MALLLLAFTINDDDDGKLQRASGQCKSGFVSIIRGSWVTKARTRTHTMANECRSKNGTTVMNTNEKNEWSSRGLHKGCIYTLGHTDYDRNIHTNTHEYTLESGQGKG